jgi:hypothetical protein
MEVLHVIRLDGYVVVTLNNTASIMMRLSLQLSNPSLFVLSLASSSLLLGPYINLMSKKLFFMDLFKKQFIVNNLLASKIPHILIMFVFLKNLSMVLNKHHGLGFNVFLLMLKQSVSLLLVLTLPSSPFITIPKPLIFFSMLMILFSQLLPNTF